MGLRTIWWCVKCVGFTVAGIIVCGQVTLYVTSIVWWCLFLSGATHLSHPTFGFEHFFGLRAIFGFMLGLIPLSALLGAARSMWARFQSPRGTATCAEGDWSRPELWAGLPLALLLLVELVLWQPTDSSVLATMPTEGRLQHFFNPMAIATMNYLAPSAPRYVLDLVIVTGPMVFLMAYSVGVVLRHQFTTLESPEGDLAIAPEEQSIEPR